MGTIIRGDVVQSTTILESTNESTDLAFLKKREEEEKAKAEAEATEEGE